MGKLRETARAAKAHPLRAMGTARVRKQSSANRNTHESLMNRRTLEVGGIDITALTPQGWTARIARL